ncbi:MAG: transcription elongation factor GreA [Candidatus Kapaibacterium sp.]|nr:transcription elongation factor GreA [Ignavibacteriota bacterium]MCB9220694.1 transcription elongation factor GreA [Ignavibacteria bacterium]
MTEKNYMTKEKYRELEEDLKTMQTKGRREIAQKIADARSHGDLSENADYDAAKEEQGLFEMKIAKLSQLLSNAEIIDPADFPDDKVYILSKVKVLNKKVNKEMTFQLVSAAEADFEKNKISVNSPLGKALMGKAIGEIAEMVAPAGTIKYEILDIEKP